MTRFQSLTKLVLDYAVATLGIPLLSPLFILIYCLIKLESRGPAILKHERLGKNGRLFLMYKFRTMCEDSPLLLNPDGSTRVNGHDPRVTRMGRFLRGGLDELPQLFNILKGEMSLVGPRPDMAFHLEYYTQDDKKKLSVKPGMTSFPAVSGRNDIPWKERIALDVRYVERYSLRLDIKIIFLTILLPFRKGGSRDGIHKHNVECGNANAK